MCTYIPTAEQIRTQEYRSAYTCGSLSQHFLRRVPRSRVHVAGIGGRYGIH